MLWQSADRSTPCARRDHDLRCVTHIVALGAHADNAVCVEDRRRIARMIHRLDARTLARGSQREKHEAGIDAVIVRRLQGEAHSRCQRRLAFARLRGPQAQRPHAEGLAKGELALELARLVGVARDHQRARPPETDTSTRELLELRGKIGPESGRSRRELQCPPPRLPELDLGDRREHARRHGRGSAANIVALDQQHGHAALRGTPSDGESDDAAAEDRHIRW